MGLASVLTCNSQIALMYALDPNLNCKMAQMCPSVARGLEVNPLLGGMNLTSALNLKTASFLDFGLIRPITDHSSRVLG